MFGRLSRSWRLAKASARILAAEPRLALVPLLSAACVAAAGAAIYFGVAEPLGLADLADEPPPDAPQDEGLEASHLLVVFLFYLAAAFVMTFFNVAIASAALGRMRGEGASVAAGLAAAAGRTGTILGYAALVAVFGVVLKVLDRRGETGGRMAAGVLKLVSSIATFLVTPVIAAERVGPLAAIRRSAALLRSTWGENLIGSGGLSLVFMPAVLLLALAGGGGAAWLLSGDGGEPAGIALGAATALALAGLVATWMALDGIYRAALYAYAVDGAVPEGFVPDEIQAAFRRKDVPEPAPG